MADRADYALLVIARALRSALHVNVVKSVAEQASGSRTITSRRKRPEDAVRPRLHPGWKSGERRELGVDLDDRHVSLHESDRRRRSRRWRPVTSSSERKGSPVWRARQNGDLREDEESDLQLQVRP
jgi:hypothetical protein